MTTHPTPRAPAKLPKAQAIKLWCPEWPTSLPIEKLWCAIIPCRTQREARAVVRLHSGDSIAVSFSERDLLCMWAAVLLRDPEPLTRLLKKILKPAVEARNQLRP